MVIRVAGWHFCSFLGPFPHNYKIATAVLGVISLHKGRKQGDYRKKPSSLNHPCPFHEENPSKKYPQQTSLYLSLLRTGFHAYPWTSHWQRSIGSTQLAWLIMIHSWSGHIFSTLQKLPFCYQIKGRLAIIYTTDSVCHDYWTLFKMIK